MSRILVVEDEAIPAMHLAMQLNQWGHEVIGPVNSASGAIELAMRERPDLIIMDVVLSGPMNGVAATEEIQQALGTPVLFLTAVALPEPAARAPCPRAVVGKPYETTALRAKLESLLQ